MGELGLPAASNADLPALEAVLAAAAAAHEALNLQSLFALAIADASDVKRLKEFAPAFYDIHLSGRSFAERITDIEEAPKPVKSSSQRKYRPAWEEELAACIHARFDNYAERAPRRLTFSEDEVRALRRLSSLAALQLVARQSPEGWWPAGPGDDEGNISTTSRAASALMKVFGKERTDVLVAPSLGWIKAHYDRTCGAFGRYVSAKEEGRPIKPRLTPTVVDTATALKVIHQAGSIEAPERIVWRPLLYLLQNRADDHGWNDTHATSASEITTTAYVLDAMHFCQPALRWAYKALEPDEDDEVTGAFEKTMHDAKRLLADRQRNGGWTDTSPSEHPDPFCTAQVLCFAHQFLVGEKETLEEALTYLTGRVAASGRGGLPADDTDEPAVTPTAMMIFGLLRATEKGGKWDEWLPRLFAYLRTLNTARDPVDLTPYASTFILLVGNNEGVQLYDDDWKDRTLKAMYRLRDARRSGKSPSECVRAALGSVSTWDSFAPALERALED